jgi:hypothetical protein
MISDVLSEAVDEIDRYLTDPLFGGIYGKEGDYLYGVIASARDEMDHARAILDGQPDGEL